MRAQWVLIAMLAFVITSACDRDRYNPSRELSVPEQHRLVRQMVYYCSKLPPNASELNKFDPRFNWYYDRAAAEASLMKYYRSDEADVWYFMLSRQARSITPMKEGIAGKVKLNADGSLADYEETFRMWKMPADTLQVRGSMLFDRMVRGKDLSLFYPQFQGDKFIELPTDGYQFDALSKRWKRAAAFP